ncbi:HEPN domain-containing protein [Pseudomonas putida]|uniref:HEPN domain-containing protein n=1 Tax=Pseudomonas putida TaxID=303 RepID=A0A6I6XY64_PSEPU|nr:HEPN domain-containing protein [Pseudomonas putida]QHG64368.1 HEPN domain-containing protein [Pseudomonas putida]
MADINGNLILPDDDVLSWRIDAHHAFFASAESLMRGVRALSGAGSEVGVALCFLAGQVSECALKALLAKQGVPLKELISIGHDIKKLWGLCFSHGLVSDSDLPDWAECLSKLHGKPYLLRYPMDVNGIVMPGPEPMICELNALLLDVRSAMLSLE